MPISRGGLASLLRKETLFFSVPHTAMKTTKPIESKLAPHEDCIRVHMHALCEESFHCARAVAQICSVRLRWRIRVRKWSGSEKHITPIYGDMRSDTKKGIQDASFVKLPAVRMSTRIFQYFTSGSQSILRLPRLHANTLICSQGLANVKISGKRDID